MNTCYNIDNKILKICKNEYNYFLSKGNVVGIGLGYKIKNGFCTFEKCIKVFVTSKILINNLSFKDLIPKYYKYIKTDVVETGYPYFSAFTSRIRPVLGGYSIGPRSINITGTLGCLVTDGTDYYLLSSNHVLAKENTLPLGTTIIQPSFEDSGLASRDTIGKLSKFIPIFPITFNNSPKNIVDCAIAKLVRKSIVSPQIALIGNLHGINKPKLESHVEKAGRTSELTLGLVTSIGTTIKVNFDSGKFLFSNQILTTKMSDKGDSGSVLVDSDNKGIGLLVGSSTCNTIYNPIDIVLNQLGVNIVTLK